MSGATTAAVLAGVASASVVAAVAGTGATSVLRLASVRPTRPGRSRLGEVLARVGASRLGRRLPQARLTELLAASQTSWSVDQAIGMKVLVVGAALVLLVPAPGLTPPLVLVGARFPELVLARRSRRRSAEASAEVPVFLDLLAMATSGGLAPQRSVRIAAEQVRGPLAEELRSALERVDLGRRWRDELGAVADRLAIPDLLRASTLLRRSEALGTSLADEMSRLAADVRERRRGRATERARTAPVKMLFPLVFLILPAFLLLTVVLVLVTTVRSIG